MTSMYSRYMIFDTYRYIERERQARLARKSVYPRQKRNTLEYSVSEINYTKNNSHAFKIYDIWYTQIHRERGE